VGEQVLGGGLLCVGRDCRLAGDQVAHPKSGTDLNPGSRSSWSRTTSLITFRKKSHYTFVTDGVESAVAQARAAAGDKYVSLMGSAVPQQCLRAGLLDEIQIHLVPVLLGADSACSTAWAPKTYNWKPAESSTRLVSPT
jgi:dihydrofolate reductase